MKEFVPEVAIYIQWCTDIAHMKTNKYAEFLDLLISLYLVCSLNLNNSLSLTITSMRSRYVLQQLA